MVKIYATTSNAFTPVDERTLELLAAAVAALLAAGQGSHRPPVVSTALHIVLGDRQAVDTATGILMERHHLSRPSAHQRLQEAANAQGRALTETARQLLDELTDPDGHPTGHTGWD